jgi:8-oxo-dGTP pyrophosphatase MutT (NUDIX family)
MPPASAARSDDADQAGVPIDQAAAVCFRLAPGDRPGRIEVLLVTSRTGEWAIPKGRVDPGFTPPQAAANEAWEEAGVRGAIVGGPIGSFEYVKVGGWAGAGTARCRVHVCPLLVERIQDAWQESGFRQRRWVAVEAAAGEVSQPGLARVLGEFPLWVAAWRHGATDAK